MKNYIVILPKECRDVVCSSCERLDILFVTNTLHAFLRYTPKMSMLFRKAVPIISTVIYTPMISGYSHSRWKAGTDPFSVVSLCRGDTPSKHTLRRILSHTKAPHWFSKETH